MLAEDLELRRALALRAITGGLLRLRWLAAATRVEVAMHRHMRALKYGYNPDQPRVPRGNPDGGQWTLVVAGGPSRSGGSRYGANFPGATYGQLVRLDLEVRRTENALREIRKYDPNWRPTVESAATQDAIEGSIRHAAARAEQAETYLRSLQGSPGSNPGSSAPQADAPRAFDGAAWINAYRATQNSRDLFGQQNWPSSQGTVAVAQIDGKLYFGVNSQAPGYTDRDFAAAVQIRSQLIERYPDMMKTDNIGERPNNSVFHAEANLLIRSAQQNGGTLEGREIEIHTDRDMCGSCETILPKLGLGLGNPRVTYVAPEGAQWVMQDGRWIMRP